MTAKLEQTGKALKGVGRITLPKEYYVNDMDFSLMIKPSNRDDLQVKMLNFNPPTIIEFEFLKDSSRVEEDVDFQYIFEVRQRVKRILKPEPNLPPKLTNTFTFDFIGSQLIIDFGYIHPSINPESLPEHSVDVHSRIQMDLELARKLYEALDSFFRTTSQG